LNPELHRKAAQKAMLLNGVPLNQFIQKAIQDRVELGA
jgi:predicted HicB family RNase H-like nuclease